MAVSLTLMAMISSIMLELKRSTLFDQPYAKRVEQFSNGKEGSMFINYDDLAIIIGHHFNSAEEIHYLEGANYFMNVTSDPASDNERSLTSVGTSLDSDFLKFLGMKSASSGNIVSSLSEKDVIISDWLAKKLFKDENPIGRYINLDYRNYDGSKINQNYVIKDVMKSQSNIYNPLPQRCHLFLLADHLSQESKASCFFILRENASRDSLAQELKEIIPTDDIRLNNVYSIHKQGENKILFTRNLILLFLFLFVLVSFSNYLRQQAQLFRLREREVALRTCVGCTPKSLYLLFITEIMIVLLLTAVLAVTIVYFVSQYFINHFGSMLNTINIDFEGAIPMILLTSAILMVISIISVTFIIRRIRKDQTGLALRMKPQPRHRLRNVGLTIQLCISIIFIWFSLMLFMSIKTIKDDHGIPENVDKYKRCLTLVTHGISKEETSEINTKIESLESIEKVYKYYYFTPYFDQESYSASTQFMAFFQNNYDVEEFFDIEVKELSSNFDPEKNVLINEEFKEMLIDQNQWNGKTVTLPFNGTEEYEIRGIFKGKTFSNQFTDKTIIVTDASLSDSNFERIILPKEGKENETKDEIERIFQEVSPSRIDLSVENWFDKTVPSYSMFFVFVVIITILSVISVITTMGCIYSAVSLDTRRRRKEMALRKLNGAGRNVIAMIFMRTYIWIISVAVMISFPLSIIIMHTIPYQGFRELGYPYVLFAYVLSLLLLVIVTGCSIMWKVRNVMKVDPIEYLKE
ncbi:MAG: FtsX-like permease family protein [Muribaculaceae bacterium]|nr:FtsX-like permease family protein [Muribaculaceae bacterium]